MEKEQTALNEDENKPMYNNFRQVWRPGSTFKPITAAIGLKSGAVDPNEDYGNVGLSWQKDASWGAYHVTTLHVYDPVVLENVNIISMVEDGKGRGGSSYVVGKEKQVLESWLNRKE